MEMNKKLFINQVVILLLMFCFKYLPTFGEMTPFGMAILGIFLGTIYGWLTMGFLFPSIVGIVALGFSGAYESMGATFAATFGSTYTPMMIGCLFIAALMSSLQLTDVLIGNLLNLKFAKNNMTLFFMLFFAAAWIVSIFSDCFVTIILFLEIYISMAKNAGIPDGSKENSFVACGIVMACMISNISLPFKAVAISIMGLFEQYSGVTMSFLQYIALVTSYQIIMFILYTLIGRFVLRIDYNRFTAAGMEKKAMTKRQKAGLISLLVMFIGYVLTSLNVPLFPYLGLGGVGLLTMIFMLVYQVEGKPILVVGEVAQKFDWGLFLMMAFFMAFIGFVGSPDVGLVATVRASMASTLSILPPALIVFISIVLTVLVSNFLNNWPVVIIFVSIMGVLVETVSGINVAAAILGIAVAGYLAYATPAANPGSAIVYGYKNLISTSTHLKVAAITSVIMALITALIYYPVLSLFL